MRKLPSGSGATTTIPSGAKNSETSAAPSDHCMRTSASTKEPS